MSVYSVSELQLLSYLGKGAASIAELRSAMGISKVQTYRTAASLEGKGAVHLENGRINILDQTHLYSLMNIMHDAASATTLLSGSGLDIIKEMREPATAREVSERLGISQRTVSRSIKGMKNVGMLSKDGDKYTINAKMWPELLQLADRYADYSESFDDRAPYGSRIYHKTKTLIVFSNDQDLNFTKTAFSRFEEYGIKAYFDTNYYCNLIGPLTIRDVMLHCFEVISKEKNWRLRMMALAFYKKYLDELRDINHPMKDEMEKVLEMKEGRIEGWVPLEEMQERAEMYGVDLYDI